MRYYFEGKEYSLTFVHRRVDINPKKTRQITEAWVQGEDGQIRHRTIATLNPVDQAIFTKARGRFYAIKKMEHIMSREEYGLLAACYFNRKEIEKGKKLPPPSTIPEFENTPA